MNRETTAPLTLSAFVDAVSGKVLTLRWKNGESHYLRLRLRPPSDVRASYTIRRPEHATLAFVSDALLVSTTADGACVKITWPTGGIVGRGAMYPFVVLIPLSRTLISTKKGHARANLRTGLSTDWDEMAAWDALVTLDDPSEENTAA